ncbi:MAG: glycosyltransferase family 4 protein [Bacteroidota bacterium]
MKRRKKIVFIGHEASLSGAPVLLLNLLLLLKKEGNVNVILVIKRYGPFLKNYENEFPVIVLKGANYGKENNLLKRIYNIIRNRIQLFRLFLITASADVVFSNTVTNGRILKILFPFRKKIVTYVHELEKVIEWYMPSGDSSYSLQYSQRFAYPSLKVSEILQKNYRIDASKLYRLSYYFPVDLKIIDDDVAKNNFAKVFREKYDLSGAFVVGNAGVLCDRKGTDLFIEVCCKVVSRNRDIKFCWIGQFEDRETKEKLTKLIKEKNIEKNIVLTGPLPHHYYNFNSFDLLFLSSREDPYPLVVIEAAFMKIPSICFKDSGGITDFINDDAGWAVGNFSVDEVAQRIIDLFNAHREQLSIKGKAAFKKALELHSDKAVILSQFNELISGF